MDRVNGAAEPGFPYHFRAGAGGPRCPTLLLLPSSGGDATDLVNLGRGLADEANLLCPRGPAQRPEAGQEHAADPLIRTGQVAELVSAAATQHDFDRRQVVAVGLSDGATLAASLLLRRPRTLLGAVLLHPLATVPPVRLPDLRGVPVFIGAGRGDALVPEAETLRLAELLLDAGAEVTLSWHPGGHAVADASFRSARTWLRLTGLISQP